MKNASIHDSWMEAFLWFHDDQARAASGRPFDIECLGGKRRAPAVDISDDILCSVIGKRLYRAVRTRMIELVEAVIAGLRNRDLGQSLTNRLIQEKQLESIFVDNVNHFLHMIEDIAQLFVFMLDAGVRIVRQQDVAQNNGKDAETADDFLGEFMWRLCTFKADAAQGVTAMGNQTMGKRAKPHCLCCWLVFCIQL